MSPVLPSKPYVTGSPALDANFYDREDLVADLLDERRLLIYLVGNRRSGKTSLLKRLEALAPAVVLYLDLSTTDGSWGSIAKELASRINELAPSVPALSDVSPKGKAGPRKLLEALIAQAKARRFQVLLLLDEAHMLLKLSNAELQRLRAVLQKGAINGPRPVMRTILAAGKQLGELNDRVLSSGASFLAGIDVLYVSPLADDAARRLVHQEQHPAGPVRVDAQTENTILRLAGNQPYLMQQLCATLFENPERRLREIQPVDRSPGLAVTAFRNDYESLSPHERCLLRALAPHRALREAELVAEARLPAGADISLHLALLAALGYLACDGDKYRIGSGLFGAWLAERLETDAHAPALTDEASQQVAAGSRMPVASPGAATPAPDLELLVVGPAEDNSVEYVLNSLRGGYNYFSCGRQRFYREPQLKLQGVLDRLSDLAKCRSQDMAVGEPDRAIEEMAEMGRGLYSEVATLAFANQYARRIRHYRPVASLMITTEEPWIPWEILRPFAGGKDGFDEPGPLCELFDMARWFRGGRPPKKLKFSTVVCIRAMDGPGANRETACLRGLADVGLTIVGPLRTRAEAQDAFGLEDRCIFHFIAHGRRDYANANWSRTRLGDDYLQPDAILRPGYGALDRALVFMNACDGGSVGGGLASVGGWAKRFFDAGASAFVGPAWEVHTDLAAIFAEAFYNRLFGLHGDAATTLGQAVREARQCVKEADPANSTWMAYVLYGNPQARVAPLAKLSGDDHPLGIAR
jgi:hypothetical protein